MQSSFQTVQKGKMLIIIKSLHKPSYMWSIASILNVKEVGPFFLRKEAIDSVSTKIMIASN